MRIAALAAVTFVAGIILGLGLGGRAVFEAGAASRATTGATEEVDLEVQNVAVSGPPSAAVGVSFNVTVDTRLDNHGPFGPVDAPIDFTLSTPADCTKKPGGPFQTATASLEVNTVVPLSATWSVTCSGAGVREFGGTATVLAGTDDYNDPNTDNNFGESVLSVTITPRSTPEAGAGALPATGGRPAGGSGPASLLAIALASGVIAVAIAAGGWYARRR